MNENIFKIRIYLYLLSLLLLLSTCKTVETLPPPSHESTEWYVRTSCGIDALCFLNGLSGDSLSLTRMSDAIIFWRGKLNDEELNSLEYLVKWREEFQTPMHSLVLKPFVAVGADSLESVIDLCDSPELMQNALLKIQNNNKLRNTYYNEENFQIFKSKLPYVKSVLKGLDRNNFSAYWNESVKPQLEIQAEHLLEYSEAFNIIPDIENALGYSLPSDNVTFYLCEFLQPYGNHVLPGVFASETKIPDEHIVRTAIHELFHNPCYNYDPPFWHTADIVWEDDFIRTRYEQRDPVWGYNTFGDYYVEDAVRALEQFVSMKQGIAVPLSKRFGPEEGGDHALAAIFYELMTQYGFGETSEGFREFIIRMEKEDALSGGKLESYYHHYMGRTHN